MVDDNTSWNEKRQHERYSVKLDAVLKVLIALTDGTKVSREVMQIKALGETNNISIGGLSISLTAAAMPGKAIPPSYIRLMLGRSVEIEIYGKEIVVWGDVLRADADRSELGIAITKVSDVRAWKNLCNEHLEGLSIFPDTLQIRRKRRSGG